MLYKPPISPNTKNVGTKNVENSFAAPKKITKNGGTGKKENEEDNDESIGPSWHAVSRRPNSPTDEKGDNWRTTSVGHPNRTNEKLVGSSLEKRQSALNVQSSTSYRVPRGDANETK